MSRTEKYTRRDSFGRTVEVTRNIDTGETVRTQIVGTAGMPGIRPPVDTAVIPRTESVPDPADALPPVVATGTDVLTRPAGNASTEAWAEYARLVGVDVAEDATRDQIRELVDAAVPSTE